jgi:hypothetical protein
MKNQANHTYLVFLVSLAFTVLTLSFLLSSKDRNKTVEDTKELNPIILECQKMASVATNENWSYKSCVEELNPDKTKIQKI